MCALLFTCYVIFRWRGGGDIKILVSDSTSGQDIGIVLYVLVYYVVVCVFSYFDVVPVHTKNNTKADIKNYFVC